MEATPKTALALIDCDRLADAVGSNIKTVRNYRHRAQMPAKWALQVRRLLAEKGRDPMAEAPNEIFAYK